MATMPYTGCSSRRFVTQISFDKVKRNGIPKQGALLGLPHLQHLVRTHSRPVGLRSKSLKRSDLAELSSTTSLLIDPPGLPDYSPRTSSKWKHLFSPENVEPPLRILLVASAFNGMTQRTKVELEQQGHEVSVQLFTSALDVEQAVLDSQPDLIICPFLKDRLPVSVYEKHICLIVHPGVMGDKGPSSLDWAMMENKATWGVTVLQATAEMDAGPVWASESFAIPPGARKSEVYNTAAADAALRAVHSAVRTLQLLKRHQPQSSSDAMPDVKLAAGSVTAPAASALLGPVLPQLQCQVDEPMDSTTGGSFASMTVVAAAAVASAAETEALDAAAVGACDMEPFLPLNSLSYSLGAGRAFRLAGQGQEYGCTRPLMKQNIRRIDWSHDSTDVIVQKIRAADGFPGVQDTLLDVPVYLYGATHEDCMRGKPKEILGSRAGAICLGTCDGAVWVSHLRRVGSKAAGTYHFKLPATMVLGQQQLEQLGVQEVPAELAVETSQPGQPLRRTFRDIWYEEVGNVGVLHFPFYNGAASTDQLQRLTRSFQWAQQQSHTRVIVLAGGPYCWNNGIHLNTIEASDNPKLEAWENILAMNQFVSSVVSCSSHITLSAMRGNAGAGGVYMGMAADYVMAHEGVVLNPHYKTMGLFGSEYWTYLSARRLGPELAADVSEACLPLMAPQAWQLGMLDEVVPGPRGQSMMDTVLARAAAFAQEQHFSSLMAIKKERRAWDEAIKPLQQYGEEELRVMLDNMMANSWGFHQKRRAFVYKEQPKTTCPAVALHAL